MLSSFSEIENELLRYNDRPFNSRGCYKILKISCIIHTFSGSLYALLMHSSSNMHFLTKILLKGWIPDHNKAGLRTGLLKNSSASW